MTGMNVNEALEIIRRNQTNLFLGCLLLNLMLVQVVLLGKLHVLQELGVATLHAHVPLERGFPEPVTVILSALVMSCVVLGLGHT